MDERRRGHNAEVAREAILNAAEEAFADAGFSGARVDKIAEDAGYNKNLIFHYFTNKLGLYHAVLARMRDLIEGQLDEILPTAGADDETPTAAQVRTFIEAAVRWSFDRHRTHPQNMRMLSWEAAEGWHAFGACKGACANDETGQWAERMQAFLRRAQTAGIVRPDLDPTMLITSVIGLTLIYHASIPRYQMLFPTTDLTSPSALDYAREQIVALVLHGTLRPHEEIYHAAGI